MLVAPTDVDHRLREGGVAEYHFDVIAEPPRPGQPMVTEYPRIDAIVQRDDLHRLGDEILGLVQREFARLVPPVGELISPHLVPLVRPWIDRALGLVEHLRDIRWRVWPGITYADPNAPTTTQPPPPAVGTLDARCPSPAEVAAATGQTVSGQAPLTHDMFPPGVTGGCVYDPEGVSIAFGSPALWDSASCPAGPLEPVSVPGASDAFLCRVPPESWLTVLVGDRLLVTYASTDAGALALADLRSSRRDERCGRRASSARSGPQRRTVVDAAAAATDAARIASRPDLPAPLEPFTVRGRASPHIRSRPPRFPLPGVPATVAS